MDTLYSTGYYNHFLVTTFHGVQSVKVLTHYAVYLELILLINYILWQIQKIKAKNRKKKKKEAIKMDSWL